MELPISFTDLRALLYAAAACIETPDDLTANERNCVVEDLICLAETLLED